MSNYLRILNEFVQKVGCNENDRFNEYGINKALDKLAYANTGQAEFNRDVAMEVFEQTPKNHDGTVTLRDYINTILRANQILYRQISETQRQIQSSQSNQERQQLKGNLDQFTDDLMLINKTFNLPGNAQNYGNSNLSNSYGQGNSRSSAGAKVMSRNPAGDEPRQSSRVSGGNESAIFAMEPSDREESTSLKIALLLLIVSVLFEFIQMFVKDPFISCLAYLFVFGIYLLNYFDRYYVRVCMYMLLASIILDLIWLIVMPGPYLNNQLGYRSTLQPGFLGYAYIMTIILMVAKAIIMIILYRYRNNDEATRKYVKLFSLRFDLDGRPVNSPVYNLMNKSNTSSVPGSVY